MIDRYSEKYHKQNPDTRCLIQTMQYPSHCSGVLDKIQHLQIPVPVLLFTSCSSWAVLDSHRGHEQTLGTLLNITDYASNNTTIAN